MRLGVFSDDATLLPSLLRPPLDKGLDFQQLGYCRDRASEAHLAVNTNFGVFYWHHVKTCKRFSIKPDRTTVATAEAARDSGSLTSASCRTEMMDEMSHA